MLCCASDNFSNKMTLTWIFGVVVYLDRSLLIGAEGVYDKVVVRSSRSQEENVAKMVGATSSEAFYSRLFYNF